MHRNFKRAASAAVAAAVIASQMTGVGIMSASAASELNKKFRVEETDPSKVMWTTTMVESVDPDYGNVDPNANNKDDSGHQNPYNNPGEKFTSWAYAEYLWTHSYPVGNGRMAGMVAGGIDKEIIQINEDTIWDGSPYGDMYNEKGEQITNISQVKDAETITMKNQTSGSVKDNWKYFRGTDANGGPAPIGSADALVGDEAFRAAYPDYANKSISNQALAVSNEHTNEAVQQRYALESMVEAKFLGNPTKQKAYKSFIEVYLDFKQDHNRVTNYTKSLDMETGVVMVDYDYMNTHFTRETFASYPDQTVATHIESTDELDFTAQLHSYHNQEGYYTFEKVSDNEIKLIASVYNGNKNGATPAGVNAIRFEARMLLDGDGVFTVSEDNTSIGVKGGKKATIYVVGASNYVDYTFLDNSKPAAECEKYIANIRSKTYEEILARHTADFTALFNSSSLSIENTNGVDNYNVPTEKRVRKDVDGKSGFLIGAGSKLENANKNGVYTTYSEGDNELAVLEFNYGKYLTIAGSRDAKSGAENGTDFDIAISQPLNLTGKWNAALSASWNGKYTININTEMNYWSAQPLGLKEVEKPLIDTFDDLAQSGSVTAAYQYGITNDRGDDTYVPGDPWVMHHNYDLWRGTQPIDNATAGLWPTGGVWLLDHAWQYYQFNLDKEYLAEVYPYMVGAAKFFTQFLVIDPETGYLITAASCSPEQGGVQPGPAMDTQLVRNLYDTVLQASEILGKTEENAELIAKIKEQMPSSYLADEKGKVAPNVIDENGLISEWVRGDVGFDFSKNSSSGKYSAVNPFKNNEPMFINEHTASNNSTHRHCSSLWEIYPGTHLSAYSTDEHEKNIYEAYRKSVEARGAGSGQGWGVAWRISLNARALDGETASKMLEQLLTTRTSPNMFDQHPNFQIDGNYGATAGVIEMLLQSHDGNIAILPAITSKWQTGEFKNFKARGDVSVSAKWADGKLTKAVLKPAHDGKLNIVVEDASNAKIYNADGKAVTAELNGVITSFDAKAGEEYTVAYGEFENEYPYTIERAVYNEGYLEAQVKYNGASSKPDAAKLIAAVYDEKGALVSVKSYDITDSDVIETTVAEPAKGTVKVTVWDSLGDMKPLALTVTAPYTAAGAATPKPGFTAQPTIDPNWTPSPEPTATPIPTAPPMPGSNTWTASADDASLVSGNYLMRNMSLLFDPTSSGKTSKTIDGKNFSYYISSGDNGKWSSGSATGTAVKYDATEDGTLTVYIADLGADKELCITKEGVSDNRANTADSAYFKASEKCDKALSLDVKAGNTYYAYVAGSKGRFVGAEFVSSGGTSATVAPTNTPKPTEDPNATPAPTPDPASAGVYIGNERFESVTAALASVTAPASEDERVYIDVMPGTYREQAVVSKPYITIRKMPGTEGEAKLTWYYGIGTLYDSCNENGYYDKSAIGDGKSYCPKDWGPALKVDKSATGFSAENITLENSYNIYYTEEELADITGFDPDPNNSDFARADWIRAQKAAGVSDNDINAALQSRKNISFNGTDASPRERSAALHCSADKATFINCTIMSTQDTIGINSGRMYFKNCKLGGTTDYICGSATAVFDGCELYTNAGPLQPESATITAPSNTAESEGYLFYNCTVTGSPTATSGSMGRPWGAAPGPAAYYINTTINKANGGIGYLISDSGWSDMSGNKAIDARFGEYGSVDADGNAIDLSKRLEGKVLDKWEMLRYNPLTFTQGSDGWDPAGLKETYAPFYEAAENMNVIIPEGSSNIVELPSPGISCHTKWISNTANIAINKDHTITVIRPAAGEEPINAELTAYLRNRDNQSIGVKRIVPVTISPTTDTENVFEINGAAQIISAAAEEVVFNVKVYSGNAVIKTGTVTIPAGAASAEFKLGNIPVGTYIVKAESQNSEYKVTYGDETEVTGAKGDSVNYAIDAVKLTEVTISTEDFSQSWAEPVLSSNEAAFTMTPVTGGASDTANIGEGNTVYKFTKADGQTVSNKAGAYWDIKKAVEDNGGTLANTDKYTFSFDMLLEKAKGNADAPNGYMAGEYSFFDLTTAMTDGSSKANQSRLARWGIHYGWNQLNMFNSANERINGDKTQLDKNSNMENKWYRIVAEVDLKNKTVTTTLYNRDNNMEILNGKSFSICEGDKFPSDIKDELFFALYMDNRANTQNKIEFYVDNLSLTYMDYE